MAPTLDKLSSNDLATLAAVYLASLDGTTDWSLAAALCGSKTSHAMRERVRMAKKRFTDQSGSTSNVTKSSPVGGVNKTPSKTSPAKPRKVALPSPPASVLAEKPVKTKATRMSAPSPVVQDMDDDDEAI